MADELQKYIAGLPAKLERQIAREFGTSVDEELVEPIRRAAPRGKTGLLQTSVRKESGSDGLSWVVAAGGDLTRKAVGTRTYRRQINIGADEETQNVPKGNASVAYDYSLAMEFGTAKVPAQPFFWPTIRSRIGRLHQRAYDIAADALGLE